MNKNNQIFDVTFKRMFRLSGRLLIKFVNAVFDKQFPLDSEVKFLDTNSADDENNIREKDLYFEVCGERFQIEAQSYWDDMMFRMFEYAVSNPGDNYRRIDSDHAEYRMPKQAVVFLKGKDKKRNELHIRLILPDESEAEYSVRAVRALGYTPCELAENGLEILLPFQIIRMYSRVNSYRSSTEERKNKFLADFRVMCNDILITMDTLMKEEKISEDEYRNMLNIIKSLRAYLYNRIEDIKLKGADSMLQEKIVLWDDRIMAEGMAKGMTEGIAKGKAEEKKELAEMMISDNKPANEIERYTGFSIATLDSIAKSLGKSLVI